MLQALFREQRARAGARKLFAEADPDARALVALLAEFCHARRSSIMVSPATGAVDPIATAVAEGRREVLLWLMAKAGADDARLDKAIQTEMVNNAP